MIPTDPGSGTIDKLDNSIDAVALVVSSPTKR
jgi:hypothetical protein